MELGNFGSIMKFAIELETEIGQLLKQASSLTTLAPKITELSELNAGNLKLLERTRREGICEMVLHPITGLNSDNYNLNLNPSLQMTEAQFQTIIKNAGDMLSKFYTEASDKLPADDAKRAFQKLSKRRYSCQGT